MKSHKINNIKASIFKWIFYLLRIALAVSVIWWCVGKTADWGSFQVFKQWNDVYGFEGSGLADDPYLINDADDLIRFSDAVNSGNFFEDLYFLQTADIDLKDCDNFTPIGNFDDGYTFRGIYDGGGHRIYNLNISSYGMRMKFVGLFGNLCGTVMNLGIESGMISGEYVGAFAATSGSDKAMIINCYNRAQLRAVYRCAGIAENFSDGRILSCANYGYMTGPVRCQIVSFNGGVICGCCNYSESGRYVVNFETFTGNLYDLYVGSDDPAELAAKYDKIEPFLPGAEEMTVRIIPW